MEWFINQARTALFGLTLALLPFVAQAQLNAHDTDSNETDESIGHTHKRAHWRDGQASDPRTWVHFHILGINDFHGQISAGKRIANRPVGSAPVLAAYLKAAQEAHGNDQTFIVHAGDQVGASPPASALLQDEPSISFLNLLANNQCHYHYPQNPYCNLVGTLGNHEFDEGVVELNRLIHGGNHPNGPFLENPYRGARFSYVCANVVDSVTGKPILPPYVIKRVHGIPVAFIGVTLKETPLIVTPTGVASVRFLDEADAINSYVPELKSKGVRAMVVLIHQGVSEAIFTGPTPALPGILPGTIGDIVTRLDKEIDVVVSGHSHGFTNTLMANHDGKPILVTQALSAGMAFAEIELALDPVSRDIVEKTASIRFTWADEGPGLIPDPAAATLTSAAEQRVAPLVSRVIGVAANNITITQNSAGESMLGDLVADAMRATMDTQFAFMNPGGLRANLAAGTVTWGALFAVQPFSNDLVRMNLTGAQIKALLNQQWLPIPRLLQISGLSYQWDNARPADDHVVELRDAHGNILDPTTRYSVTVNNFMAAGGDAFTVLLGGSDPVVGPVDLDALIAYIQALPQPFSVTVVGRIQRLN